MSDSKNTALAVGSLAVGGGLLYAMSRRPQVEDDDSPAPSSSQAPSQTSPVPNQTVWRDPWVYEAPEPSGVSSGTAGNPPEKSPEDQMRELLSSMGSIEEHEVPSKHLQGTRDARSDRSVDLVVSRGLMEIQWDHDIGDEDAAGNSRSVIFDLGDSLSNVNLISLNVLTGDCKDTWKTWGAPDVNWHVDYSSDGQNWRALGAKVTEHRGGSFQYSGQPVGPIRFIRAKTYSSGDFTTSNDVGQQCDNLLNWRGKVTLI